MSQKFETITVNEQQARDMAARFTTYATDWAGEHAVYAGLWAERASTLLAVADYLRDEPAAESVNFDEYAAIYWPVRVYRDDAIVTRSKEPTWQEHYDWIDQEARFGIGDES